MPVNVTYLLGAGASFEVLPLVKDIFDSNGNLKKPGMGQDMLQLASEIESDFSQYGTMAIKSLRDLGNKTTKFSSPDTYIRSLWLKGGKDEEIEMAKRTMSFYLTVQQLKEKEARLDSRYIPFLSSILESNKKI